MLMINCPWCGFRDETEFKYGGQAHVVRPSPPELASDKDWADYLYMRKNEKGDHFEQWCHSSGCRRWFNVERNTVTNEMTRSYTTDEK